MKLDIDFTALENLVKKMGATVIPPPLPLTAIKLRENSFKNNAF